MFLLGPDRRPTHSGAMYVPGRAVNIWPENWDQKLRNWEKFTNKAGKLAALIILYLCSSVNLWLFAKTNVLKASRT